MSRADFPLPEDAKQFEDPDKTPEDEALEERARQYRQSERDRWKANPRRSKKN